MNATQMLIVSFSTVRDRSTTYSDDDPSDALAEARIVGFKSDGEQIHRSMLICFLSVVAPYL